MYQIPSYGLKMGLICHYDNHFIGDSKLLLAFNK